MDLLIYLSFFLFVISVLIGVRYVVFIHQELIKTKEEIVNLQKIFLEILVESAKESSKTTTRKTRKTTTKKVDSQDNKEVGKTKKVKTSSKTA